MSSGNASLDLAVLMLSQNTNTQLGILLAIAEQPTVIPKLLKQLETSGPLGREIFGRYRQARDLLNTVP
jgi:hypothetical protein